jgi:hypothetical protein
MISVDIVQMKKRSDTDDYGQSVIPGTHYIRHSDNTDDIEACTDKEQGMEYMEHLCY